MEISYEWLSDCCETLRVFSESLSAIKDKINNKEEARDYDKERCWESVVSLYNDENFKGGRLAEYWNTKKKAFYDSKLIEYLNGILEMGIGSFEFLCDYGLAEEKYFYQFGCDGDYYWNEWAKIVDEVGRRIKEIVDIYMYDTDMEQPKRIEGIPVEFYTEEAMRYFAKARESGLIDGNFKWLKGKQLLASFCHDMSQNLNLGKGDRIAWKPFESLFGIENGTLRSNYNDIQKTGTTPSDIALVDNIFK